MRTIVPGGPFYLADFWRDRVGFLMLNVVLTLEWPTRRMIRVSNAPVWAIRPPSAAFDSALTVDRRRRTHRTPVAERRHNLAQDVSPG
jgi:hypothetical protein